MRGRSDLGAWHPSTLTGGRHPEGSTVGLKADFNGDGFGDLAIGVPGEGVGSASNAGGVNVLYGSGSGLASAGNQFWSQGSSGVDRSWSQDSAGILGVAEAEDFFGDALSGRVG